MSKMSTQEVNEGDGEEQRRCHIPIDVPMLPCKICWYLVGSAVGLTVTYQNPFLVSVGLSAREAGLISAIAYIFLYEFSLLGNNIQPGMEIKFIHNQVLLEIYNNGTIIK